jgi:hypothetical protein
LQRFETSESHITIRFILTQPTNKFILTQPTNKRTTFVHTNVALPGNEGLVGESQKKNITKMNKNEQKTFEQNLATSVQKKKNGKLLGHIGRMHFAHIT